jgi:hypothetical protein
MNAAPYPKPLATVKAPQSWIDLCHSAIAIFMLNREFTTDDIHGLVPHPSHPNHWGAMMSALKKSKVIVECGYTVSKRPSANGRRVLKWRLQ